MPGEDVILPGTFSPGHSPGTALFDSLALVDTSHLIMEIAGRDPGDYDHMSVDGLLTFDGILEVKLLNGFMPIDGDSFDLFDWSSVSGEFDQLLLPPLVPGLAWDSSQLYVTGTLSVVDPPTNVPAPHTLLLGAAALGTAFVTRRRR
jgi:MYXO-CTERM domain-containing protein